MGSDAEPSSLPTRIWRVRAIVFGPVYVNSPPDGGLPEMLEFHSRLPPQARAYGDIPVAIQEVPEAIAKNYESAGPRIKPVWLAADVGATDINEAMRKVGPVFEAITDLMSFEMGTPLPMGQVDVSDITPPKQLEDERETAIYGAPPFSVNSCSVDMQAIQGRMLGQLPDSLDIESSRLAAALRWFVKALSTNLLHDQFIFLWIALEILSDDSPAERVLASYIGPCGHIIASCPECGRATESMVRGPTLRAFLESFDIDAEKARELWAMRQLMHGAIPFDSKKLESLGSLVQALRAVVAAALKERLGKSPSDLPVVASSGLSVHPALAVQGTGLITEEEIQPLVPDTSS